MEMQSNQNASDRDFRKEIISLLQDNLFLFILGLCMIFLCIVPLLKLTGFIHFISRQSANNTHYQSLRRIAKGQLELVHKGIAYYKDEIWHVQQTPQATMITPPERAYIVQPGDTLFSIAEKTLGTGEYYSEIIAYNAIANPDTIEVGTHLRIPPTPVVLGVVKQSGDITEYAASVTRVPDANMRIHTLTTGERLWDVAEKYYHDGNKWTIIATVNNLSYPDTVEVGTVLRIP